MSADFKMVHQSNTCKYTQDSKSEVFSFYLHVRREHYWTLWFSFVTSQHHWLRELGFSSSLASGRFSRTGSNMWVYLQWEQKKKHQIIFVYQTWWTNTQYKFKCFVFSWFVFFGFFHFNLDVSLKKKKHLWQCCSQRAVILIYRQTLTGKGWPWPSLFWLKMCSYT